jgi:hypothetical protein
MDALSKFPVEPIFVKPSHVEESKRIDSVPRNASNSSFPENMLAILLRS